MLQIFQISYRKKDPLGICQLVHSFNAVFQSITQVTKSAGFQHIKPLHQRTGQRVNDLHLNVRILLCKHLCCDLCGLHGGTKLGGNTDTKDIFSLFCLFFKNFIIIIWRRCRCQRKNIGLRHHFPVKILQTDFYTFFFIFFSVKRNQEMHLADFFFFHDFFRQIAGTVTYNSKIFFHKNPLHTIIMLILLL